MNELPDDMNDFDPDEIAEAERLDAAIDDVLAGRAVDSVTADVAVLVNAMRADPPAPLGVRVAADCERNTRRRTAAAWRRFRYAAAVVAYLFIAQGIGNLVWGDWVAEGVGDAYSPHAMREGAFALMAVGIVVAASVFYRRFAPVAVASAVPLAVLLGIGGIAEIGEFAPGAILHLSQGAAGLTLLATFLWWWRDRSVPGDEDGV